MTRQPATGALPGTSPTGHQATQHQVPAARPDSAGSGTGVPERGALNTNNGRSPACAVAGYGAWGWPVTLRRGQVRLNLDGDTLALVIPVLLATEVTAILATRRCPVPVLAHPYAPEHRILLVAQRFGVARPWPPCVREVTGTLLLPPTVTPRGPISWIQLPEPDALPLCGEIDILTALYTALNDPPAPH
ncbi:MAG: hypothetical protein ACRDSR_01375 [Pseudonocardiaceae bacterium]